MGFDLEMVVTPKQSSEQDEGDDDAMSGYFRLDYQAMPVLLEAMHAAGIIDAELKDPEFPAWPPKGLAPERAEAVRPVLYDADERKTILSAAEEEIVARFVAARDEVCRTRSERPGLVPAFKFHSNDAWWITPDECQSIDEGLRKALRDNRQAVLKSFVAAGCEEDIAADMIETWAAYNRLASSHGGYRVY